MDENFVNFSRFLVSACEHKIIYIYFDPEVIDFSNKNFSFNLNIGYPNSNFTLTLDKNNFKCAHSFMKESIFKNNTKIITYNFKNYCSVYKSLTNKDIDIESDIFDLKVISCLLGDKIDEAPKDFTRAYRQLKNILQGSWEKIKNVYRDIHLPLILKVIPGIENRGIIDLKDKVIKKSYYEIEGQENSRLSNFNCLKNCFLPMNLKTEDKKNYLPTDQDEFFVYFDYKNMEVSILESLTKDSNLNKILKNYEDFYEGLYKEIISPDNFDKEKRKKVKNIFLPYVYGASTNLISERCNIKLEIVEEICKRIKETFSKTFRWLEDYTNNHDNGFYKNKFGKKRKIDQKYKAVNFIVQSTSSMFCLDKLIDLYNALGGQNINFYIHDGYVFAIKKQELDSKIKMIKNILLEESENFKDMVINVSCSYGRNLNEMIEYKEVK